MKSITAFGLPDFPLVKPGDDLVSQIIHCAEAANEQIRPDDVILIAQKVVSKAEGRLIRLGDVTPSAQAIEIAVEAGKDPRAVEVVLSDANEVIRVRPGLLVVEQKGGWICANAGVDRSNIEPANSDSSNQMTSPNADSVESAAAGGGKYNDDDILSLLPVDADASATYIRQGVAKALKIPEEEAPAIIITDSHGRAWRSGIVGICIGCAGIPPVWDQRGLHDLFGYELKGSEEGIADELAAMAGLLMGASNEGIPIVIVRGFPLPANAQPAPAKSMQRPKDKDAFR